MGQSSRLMAWPMRQSGVVTSQGGLAHEAVSWAHEPKRPGSQVSQSGSGLGATWLADQSDWLMSQSGVAHVPVTSPHKPGRHSGLAHEPEWSGQPHKPVRLAHVRARVAWFVSRSGWPVSQSAHNASQSGLTEGPVSFAHESEWPGSWASGVGSWAKVASPLVQLSQFPSSPMSQGALAHALGQSGWPMGQSRWPMG